MDGILMNAGWEQQHRGAFKPITLTVNERENTIWPSNGIRTLFALPSDFARGQQLDGYLSTFVARAEGIRGLGGIWDLALIDWVGKSDVERQEAVLNVQQTDGFLARSDVLHVRFQGGSLYKDSMFWLELYNPNSFRRERMGFAEFNAFVKEVESLAKQSVEDERYKDAAGLDPFSPMVAQEYLRSASMLLANHFAAKRMPLASIMELLARMNSYADVHACLSQLPDGGEAAALPPRRLALLFG